MSQKRSIVLSLTALGVLALGVSAVASSASAGTSAATAPHAAACARTTVVGVAHQDDDLLFINPQIEKDYAGGACIRVIYLTGGDAGQPFSSGYVQRRELGVEQAYAVLAGVKVGPNVPSRWKPSPVRVNGRVLHSATLSPGGGKPSVQLVFMRLPDGEPTGTGTEPYSGQSLLKLFNGSIRTMIAVDGSARYTQGALLDTLAKLIVMFHATNVRTSDWDDTELDYSYTDPVDHADHAVTARDMRIAALIAQRTRPAITISAYEGYGMATRPANLSVAAAGRKAFIFENYNVHDEKNPAPCPGVYCPPGSKALSPDYALWVRRFYPRPAPAPKAGQIASWIGDTDLFYVDADQCLTITPDGKPATDHCTGADPAQQWRLSGGKLRQTDPTGRCLTMTATAVRLAACTKTHPTWTVTAIGQLRSAGRCLTQDDMLVKHPTLHPAPCTSINPGQRWFLGKGVKSSSPPAASPVVPVTG